MYIIGVDVGGTKMEAMLLHFGHLDESKTALSKFEFQGHSGETALCYLLFKKRVPTERHHGYTQIVERLAELIRDVCTESEIDLHEVRGIGLSLPGPIHPKTEVLTSSNSMIFVGHNVQQDLANELKVSFPIAGENDANCFALAEACCGVGLDFFKETKIPLSKQVSIGIILGSGCGGGVIVNGGILSGKNGGTGEFGHTILYSEGWPCYCGRTGCAEQYLSGPALEAALNNRIYSQIPKRLGAEEIFRLYQAQDPIALAVIKQYRKDLARFLGNLTCAFDPHYFVLGGGLSLQNLIYEDLPRKVAENTYLPEQTITVYKHKVGDTSGAIGAAIVVLGKISSSVVN